MGQTSCLIAGLLFGSATLLAAAPTTIASAEPAGDLRDIRVGAAVADLPPAGYAGFACATAPDRSLVGWQSWRDCPADAAGMHAVRFGYDPATDPEGTRVAGHPVLLTLLIGGDGHVAELWIETDPRARLYLRKKAFLLGAQAKSRYGAEGWACSEGAPTDRELPVGGVFMNETCMKAADGRKLVVERKLFRRPEQDLKDFVGETRISVALAKG